jgi:hypothetical protein
MMLEYRFFFRKRSFKSPSKISDLVLYSFLLDSSVSNVSVIIDDMDPVRGIAGRMEEKEL